MKRFLPILILVLISNSALASEWIKRADFGGVGRHRGTGIAIGSKGYIGLGHYNGTGFNVILNDWWEYDPASNAWTQKANYPGGFGQGAYGVLAFGTSQYGFIGGGQGGSANEFWRYDPSTNAWTPAAPTPVSIANIYGFAIGDKGYMLSGGSVYEYDANTNLWSMKNPGPSSGVWNSTFVIDGKGYLKSGSQLWEYKPTIDQWAIRASFPGSASAGSASFTQNGRGYIVTGYAGWLSQVNKEVWEYNPGTNTWDSLPEFDGTSRRFSASFNIGNRCYLGTGTNGTNFADFWEFDALAGVNENFEITQFSAYPNPAVESITFKSDNVQEFSISIYNVFGQQIENKTTQNSAIIFERNDAISGTYFYQVIVKNQVVHSGKFIFK